MYFRYFVIITHWKKAGPFILKYFNLILPRTLYAKIEIGPVVDEKKMKMGTGYRQTDGRTDRRTDDDGQQAIRKVHFQLKKGS